MIIADITITSDEADGTWTSVIKPPKNPKHSNFGYLGLTIKDNGDGNTIRVQCSIDEEVSWQDVETFTATSCRERAFDPTINALYRAGCANGDYSTGSPYVALTK